MSKDSADRCAHGAPLGDPKTASKDCPVNHGPSATYCTFCGLVPATTQTVTSEDRLDYARQLLKDLREKDAIDAPKLLLLHLEVWEADGKVQGRAETAPADTQLKEVETIMWDLALYVAAIQTGGQWNNEWANRVLNPANNYHRAYMSRPGDSKDG